MWELPGMWFTINSLCCNLGIDLNIDVGSCLKCQIFVEVTVM